LNKEGGKDGSLKNIIGRKRRNRRKKVKKRGDIIRMAIG
jgi:hypothetical protein